MLEKGLYRIPKLYYNRKKLIVIFARFYSLYLYVQIKIKILWTLNSL